MTPSKEQIKSWLKTIGKDREWLAKQCGAKSKRTVEKWFETKGIVPAKAILKINELMLQTQYQSSIQPSNLPNQDNRGKMELRLDYDTQRRVEKKLYASAWNSPLTVQWQLNGVVNKKI